MCKYIYVRATDSRFFVVIMEYKNMHLFKTWPEF